MAGTELTKDTGHCVCDFVGRRGGKKEKGHLMWHGHVLQMLKVGKI